MYIPPTSHSCAPTNQQKDNDSEKHQTNHYPDDGIHTKYESCFCNQNMHPTESQCYIDPLFVEKELMIFLHYVI